jgi:hypothetical protein
MGPKVFANCRSSKSTVAPRCAADAVLTTRAGAEATSRNPLVATK